MDPTPKESICSLLSSLRTFPENVIEITNKLQKLLSGHRYVLKYYNEDNVFYMALNSKTSWKLRSFFLSFDEESSCGEYLKDIFVDTRYKFEVLNLD